VLPWWPLGVCWSLGILLMGMNWWTTAARGATWDVYILTGQSNSLGTTNLENPSGPGSHPADTETAFFWSNVNSSNTGYPPLLYGDSNGLITTLQVQQGDAGVNPSFWGPEMGMARKLWDAGQRDVLVIKASRGGGGNTYWDQEAFESNPNSGHMWGHLRDTVDAGLAAISVGDLFEVKGFIYLQGESNTAAEAAIADVRLGELIENLKSHINFAYPNTADSVHTVIGEIAASGSNANRIQTTQRQIALAAADPKISFVATSDLPLKGDGIHFGRDEKLAIGERFADVFIGVSEQPNGVFGDVNQDGVVATGTANPADDDVTAFVAGWQSVTSGLTNLQKTLAGDLNLSGRTTLADAFILHKALQLQGAAFPLERLNAVPEPTSAMLLIVAAMWVGKCRTGAVPR
jgi:hypothetical protein